MLVKGDVKMRVSPPAEICESKVIRSQVHMFGRKLTYPSLIAAAVLAHRQIVVAEAFALIEQARGRAVPDTKSARVVVPVC